MRYADLYLRSFDWGWALAKPRPAHDIKFCARLLGFGVDLTWNNCLRYYAVSLGAMWLINLGLGVRFDTSADFTRVPEHAHLYGATRFISLTVFNLSLDIGKDAGKPIRVRLFWCGRRLFYKRPA